MPLHTGSIKYAATDTEPADTTGNIYYDLSEKKLKAYNGTAWAAVNASDSQNPGDGPYTADGDTEYLLHMEDTGLDDATYQNHQTIKGGNVTRGSAGTAKHGTYSAYFDGTGDYLQLGLTSTADAVGLNFGTGSGTIDCWVNHMNNGNTNRSLFGRICHNNNPSGAGDTGPCYPWGGGNWGSYGWRVMVQASGYLQFYTHPGQGQSNFVGSTAVPTNAWYHVALVKNGNEVKTYLNGVAQGSSSDAANFEAGTQGPVDHYRMTIGINYDNGGGVQGLHGYIDEFRVSSSARWTSDFSVT